jgi:hypothetical protein
MPRLSVVPDEPPPLGREVRDAELRRIVHDLSGLLVTIVGTAYSLRVALPNSGHRRDALDIEETGRRAAILAEQLAAVVGPGTERLAHPADVVAPGVPDWEGDQGRS